MVVNRDRQSFFGVVLSDTLKIELPPDFGGLGDVDPRFLLPRLCRKLFVQHLLAKDDAVVANIDARAGD